MLARKLTDEPLRKLVKQIELSTDRMARLVRDLLDVAALDAGGLSLQLGAVDALALVRDAVELVEAQAASRGQRVCLELPDQVPQLTCDRERVLQVLLNLLDNALKYSPDGSKITATLAPDGEGMRFSVRDAGPGIPSDQHRRVFEPFWRAGGGPSGTGLGLSIVRRIVEAHGGRVWFESQTGDGSCFSFRLPADQSRTPANVTSSRS